MALETMKGLERIDRFKVLNIDDLAEKHPDKWDAKNRRFDWDWFKETVYPQGNYIIVDNHKNSITFKIQNGPIKENGVNGCQVDTLIATACHMIERLNNSYPCDHNEMAVANLTAAYDALKLRKKDREKRGVEGENKE